MDTADPLDSYGPVILAAGLTLFALALLATLAIRLVIARDRRLDAAAIADRPVGVFQEMADLADKMLQPIIDRNGRWHDPLTGRFMPQSGIDWDAALAILVAEHDTLIMEAIPA